MFKEKDYIQSKIEHIMRHPNTNITLIFLWKTQMRLVTFTHNGETRIGNLSDGQILDFSAVNSDLPTEMIAFLQAGDAALVAAKSAIDTGCYHIAVSDVTLEAPVPRPSKILSVGLNYAAHAEECEVDMPEVPVVFNKQTSAVNGPFDDVYLPPESTQLDYEGELGVIIGKRCRRVPKDKVEGVIAGYTTLNDITLRDWQLRISQWSMGKSWDTHCPFGPAIVTRDEISDPHNLDMCVWVNEELRQNLCTRDLYFDVFDIISYLSTACTLEPGDLITTGTGAGVALYMEPQQWLKEGDVVRVEISEVGEIRNKVVAEPKSVTMY